MEVTQLALQVPGPSAPSVAPAGGEGAVANPLIAVGSTLSGGERTGAADATPSSQTLEISGFPWASGRAGGIERTLSVPRAGVQGPASRWHGVTPGGFRVRTGSWGPRQRWTEGKGSPS